MSRFSLKNLNQQNPHPRKLLILAILTILPQSCAIISYHDADKGRTNLRKNQSAINREIQKMKESNEILSSLFLQSQERGEDLFSPPFPALKALYDNMLVIQSRIEAEQSLLNKILSDYENTTKGKTKIEEGSATYIKAHRLYDRYGVERKSLQPLTKAYNNDSQKFYALTKSKDLLLIHVAEAFKSLEQYNKKVGDRSQKIEAFIDEFNKKLDAFNNPAKDRNHQNQIQTLRKQIEALSSDYIKTKRHTEQSIGLFKSEVGNYKYVWTSPDMKIRKLYQELDQENSMINGKIEQIRSSWNELTVN